MFNEDDESITMPVGADVSFNRGYVILLFGTLFLSPDIDLVGKAQARLFDGLAGIFIAAVTA